MSRRVSLLARVDQIVAKGDWSRERAQQRQAHHVHTRTSDKRGKRLLGTQATIEYYSHQLKKQDKAPKTPQNAEDARRLDDGRDANCCDAWTIAPPAAAPSPSVHSPRHSLRSGSLP